MTNEKARPRALVTGASAGIGEVFATKLAKRGYDLAITARRKDRLEVLAEKLADAGAATEVIEADLTIDADVGLLEATAREVDLLVNNAGFGTVGNFQDLPIERNSTIHLTRAFVGARPPVEKLR